MNKQLTFLYQQDTADRKNQIPNDQLNQRDQQRIIEVEKILEQSQTFEAEDYHHAALIFHHGETLSHIKQANELAKKAVALGDDSARWLAAATLDRALLMAGKPQKYGTQFIRNESQVWELALPIDPTVTDDERAEWHVSPLHEALKIYKQKNT